MNRQTDKAIWKRCFLLSKARVLINVLQMYGSVRIFNEKGALKPERLFTKWLAGCVANKSNFNNALYYCQNISWPRLSLLTSKVNKDFETAHFHPIGKFRKHQQSINWYYFLWAVETRCPHGFCMNTQSRDVRNQLPIYWFESN